MSAPTVIVCGLGYGDEGKGTLTDFLVRTRGARTVVRYNGGPQAGHNVVTADGRWHCFAQLGAGSFVAGTRTVLGPEMLVELEALAAEAAVLAGKGVDVLAARNVLVDPGCALVTPMHKLVNQLGELAAARGSCGMGVGEAVKWRERGLVLRIGDLGGDALGVLERMRDHAFAVADALLADAATTPLVIDRDTAAMLDVRRYFEERCVPRALLARYREIAARLVIAPAAIDGPVIFEGAQGALLDRTRGFVPFVTQSRSTMEHALALAGGRRVERIGVIRAYHHRHGRGPLVTEDPALPLDDLHNAENRWQGPFRAGHLDLVALRYGLLLAGPIDQLAITSLDRLAGLPELRLCTAYEYTGDLAELADLADHEPLGTGRARIRALRVPADLAAARRLTAVVERCRPLDWITLDGFDAITGDLPAAARAYVDAIARELGIRIGIVSIAPDAAGKLETFPA